MGTGTWLITVAPAGAFLIGYGYERAFADARAIPLDMVSVRAESVALAFASLVFIFLLAIKPAASVLIRNFPKKLHAHHWSLWSAGLWFAVAFTLFVQNPFSRLMPGAFLAFSAAHGIAAFVQWRKSKTTPAQTQAPAPGGEPEAASTAPTPAATAAPATKTPAGSRSWWNLDLVVGVLFLFVLLVKGAGTAAADNETVFLVYEDAVLGEVVILRTYDGTVVGELDRENRTVGPRYRVVSLDDVEQPLRRERLGRLTTADPTDSDDD